MEKHLFWMGYRGISPGQFWKKLAEADVSYLLDVRITPWSGIPDFRKENLKEECESRSIFYSHVKSLGNPYRPPHWKGSVADRRVLLLKDFQEGKSKKVLDKIGNMLSDGERIVLLCACDNAQRCHTNQILEALKAKSFARRL